MEEVKDNPYQIFGEWYKEAGEAVDEPQTMVVSTCGEDMQPSSRIVYLRAFDERGFVFYTNYTSRKGRALKDNPKASLNFYWEPLKRQVKIDGDVEKVSDHESDGYFAARPRGSQIGAWASKQSMPITEPDGLAKRVEEINKSFEGEEVPRPPFWGGYRVVPKRIEFWKMGEFRLHTRLVYLWQNGKWEEQLLYP